MTFATSSFPCFIVPLLYNETSKHMLIERGSISINTHRKKERKKEWKKGWLGCKLKVTVASCKIQEHTKICSMIMFSQLPIQLYNTVCLTGQIPDTYLIVVHTFVITIIYSHIYIYKRFMQLNSQQWEGIHFNSRAFNCTCLWWY